MRPRSSSCRPQREWRWPGRARSLIAVADCAPAAGVAEPPLAADGAQAAPCAPVDAVGARPVGPGSVHASVQVDDRMRAPGQLDVVPGALAHATVHVVLDR